MNLILLTLLFAILILIFKKKEHFSKCFKGICFPVPDIPSPDDIFWDIKKKIENDVVNPVLNGIKKTANDAKNKVDKVINTLLQIIHMIKNIRIRSEGESSVASAKYVPYKPTQVAGVKESVKPVAAIAINNAISFFCFTGETLVSLSNGKKKMIKNIEVGDKILGWGGTFNTVSHLEIYDNFQKIKNRQIYGINNIDPFFTDGHVFMTTEGWKSINPEQTLIELPKFQVKKLQVGDVMFKINYNKGKITYKPICIKKITSKSIDTDKLLYNLGIVGNYSYHANGFVTHNMYDIEDSDETELDSIENLSPKEVERLRNAVKSALPEILKVFGFGQGLELVKALEINPQFCLSR